MTTFIITADVPPGVTIGEFASHLADAHRRAVASYHDSDPLSGMADVEVFAAVAAGALPASRIELDDAA